MLHWWQQFVKQHDAESELSFAVEQHDPADGNQRTEEFFPFERGFFHSEPAKQFDGISHDDLCDDNKQSRFGRTEAVHAADNRVSDKSPEYAAEHHVPGPHGNEGRDRNPFGKKPEDHAGKESAELDPSGREPDAGLAGKTGV